MHGKYCIGIPTLLRIIMKYMLRIVHLKRGEERILIIEFEQPKYIALSDFFSDVDQFELYIRENFKKVLTYQADRISFFCNLCSVFISPTTTIIISNYAIEAGNEIDRCEVKTKALVELIDWWCMVKEKWKRTGVLPGKLEVWYEWHGTGDGSLPHDENDN